MFTDNKLADKVVIVRAGSTPMGCRAQFRAATLLAFWVLSSVAYAQLTASAKDPRTAVDKNGTAHTAGFDMPFSSYASAKAREAYIDEVTKQPSHASPLQTKNVDIATRRKWTDEEIIFPLLRKQLDRWPGLLDIRPQEVAGVYTEFILPKAGIAAANRNRVLINVHGGGFTVGARTQGRLESLPIAALARIKVITIDYRMAPEHKFPAASEDVATVYKELLKEYRPKDIGIYGCSSGGMLTAEVIAWFVEKKLPLPGAVGMFGGTGLVQLENNGDSAYLSYHVFRTSPAPPRATGFSPDDYFSGADLDSPLVSPVLSPATRSRFPASLLLSGGRSFEASALITANNALTLSGVKSRLHLWDGLGHCFFLNPDIPESHEAEKVIVEFFNENLGT